MQPQLGRKKREYIENALIQLGATKETVQILEWGSGGSTVYFSRFLHKQNIPFQWVSLEYNAEWYERVQKEVKDDASVTLLFFDTEGKDPRKKEVPMKTYIQYPSTLNQTFDLIIVDGRKRKNCVQEARKLVSEHGSVLLDDAFRPRYWPALREYPESKFLFDDLWVGKIKKPNILKRTLYFLNRLFYFTYFHIKWFKKQSTHKVKHLLLTRNKNANHA